MLDNCLKNKAKQKVSVLSNLLYLIFFLLLLCIVFSSCKEETKNIGEKSIVHKPAEINPTASEIIRTSLEDAIANNGHLPNIQLKFPSYIDFIYRKNNFVPIWTNAGKWTERADSLFQSLNDVYTFGLFPEDYHFKRLTELRQETLIDTVSKENNLDASLWAETDILFTSAFINLIKDVKRGRLIEDSLILKDSVLNKEFFEQQFSIYKEVSGNEFLKRLEPKHAGYKDLKWSLETFLIDADLKKYSYIDPKDSTNLFKSVLIRLSEEDTSINESNTLDSSALATCIKKYQKLHNLKTDGKITLGFINRLNNTDREKFIRIGINLDRYKLLPNLPAKHIWVNIPSYQLKVIDDSFEVISSKVVVGKPISKTPLLTSVITDMITYPKWHIPNSIIEKEILPGLKRDINYLAKKGYSLADYKGNEIDPASVNWDKFEKNIPFRVIQGSGDDNALGVIKFNFPNNFSVYLHDTNQRHLFSKEKRALSHGCVRVESWDNLACYLLEQDTVSKNAIPIDSLNTWLALKEKHVIPLRNKIPLFIRYFTCESEDGNLVVHEDIYGEDRRMREKYFKEK